MSDKHFYLTLFILAIVAILAAPYPQIAMWVGFIYAGYSVIANDSIQTLGTFLAANKNRPALMLWLFVAGLMVITTIYSWSVYQGDVSYQRLTSKGFEAAPVSFSPLQLMAPLFLLFLTRHAIPVSTTFLILSAFATEASSISSVLSKSVSGYFVAFACSLAVWMIGTEVMKKYEKRPASRFWYPLQWVTSGFLWSVWIMQDAANVAVFLPRELSLWELIAYLTVLCVTLGLLLRSRGGRIQEVVNEKTNVADVRQATLIDLFYAGILYYFKVMSAIPMSTTWVFIGLLAGREVGMKLRSSPKGDWKATRKTVFVDLARVSLGLVISLLLAIGINPVIRQALLP
jgi:hypothetical protein